MKIAEFFAELGVKGSEKTLGALSNVKKGFGEITSLSLEAKAGMVAAFYAFEKFMSASAQTGTNLTNFTALTNLSAQSLQEYQYAARQAGVTNEELTGSLKAVQGQMTNMLLGKSAPEGLGLVASTVGFDPNKARDTFYVMQKLQEFARKVPPDVGNQVLKSFGLGEGVIAAMRRNVFRPEVFKNAPKYSPNEINSLDKANIAWGNLGQKIQMAFGHFNALHGQQMVKDLSMITTQVIRLVEALTKLTDKAKVFEILGKAVQGWASVIETDAEIVDAVRGIFAGGKDKEKGEKKLKGMVKDLGILLEPEAWKMGAKDFVDSFSHKKIAPKAAIPKIPRAPQSQNQQNIEVNQNFHFQHDGKDHKRTGDAVGKEVNRTLRQLPQGQGG